MNANYIKKLLNKNGFPIQTVWEGSKATFNAMVYNAKTASTYTIDDVCMVVLSNGGISVEKQNQVFYFQWR